MNSGLDFCLASVLYRVNCIEGKPEEESLCEAIAADCQS